MLHWGTDWSLIIDDFIDQAPVVQTADNFIHWIGRYAADKSVQEFSKAL